MPPMQDILTNRQPELTAMAIHPSGHLIATGHADGSIVFWAVEDEDKPLLGITLDGSQDVNIVNVDKLDHALAGQIDASSNGREPIFKLTWSGFENSTDPRGGETVLTVLGGLSQADVFGVTALLLPAFNPPEPPAQSVPGAPLDPSFRQCLRQMVTPLKSHNYTTSGVPQDFLLLPREQPHFSGSWDPISILLLSDADKEARVIEAYQFPPPIFIATKEHSKSSPDIVNEGNDEALAQEIASALDSMQLDDGPKPLDLPPALWSGPSGVLSGRLINLDRAAYEVLIERKGPKDVSKLGTRGGIAWVDDSDGEMKLMKVLS